MENERAKRIVEAMELDNSQPEEICEIARDICETCAFARVSIEGVVCSNGIDGYCGIQNEEIYNRIQNGE